MKHQIGRRTFIEVNFFRKRDQLNTPCQVVACNFAVLRADK